MAETPADRKERRRFKIPRVRIPRLRTFSSFAFGYWRGASGTGAWLRTLSVIGLILCSLAVQIGINQWNAKFFNALQNKDGEALFHYALMFLGLLAAGVAVAVAMVVARIGLQIAWRRWLTSTLVSSWLKDRRFYQLNFFEGDHDCPEARIVDDAHLATEPVVDFGVGILNAVLVTGSFVLILWNVGGSYTLELNGSSFTIPGYLVVAVLIYSTLTSLATVLVGRPIVTSMQNKNQAEAKLRFELTRIRENAESIALIRGETKERQNIFQCIKEFSDRWRLVRNHQAMITIISNGNAIFAPVVPLLIGWPKYVSGDLTLGELMQAAAAFGQVQFALNWLVENFIRLAQWKASARRVENLMTAMSELSEVLRDEEGNLIVIEKSATEKDLALIELSVAQSSGVAIIDDAEITIQRGEKVLIEGESGTGKSTLIRAIAGLWPWGAGIIRIPADAKVMFCPQRPYIPLGTLRAAATYPDPPIMVDDEILRKALVRCGLKYLIPRLDDQDVSWDKTLSGGEQQRLAFVRMLVQKPDVLIMDESTSALDEASQESLMGLFKEDLADVTVITVGHRPSLAEYHQRRLILIKQKQKGARLHHAEAHASAQPAPA